MNLPRCLLVLPLLIAGAHAGETVRFDAESGPPAAAFVYDPLAGESRENRASFTVAKETTFPTGLDADSSFTVEAFARPAEDLETKPRQILPVFAFAEGTTSLCAGIRRSPAPHSYPWWHVRLRKGSAPPIDLARNRYNGISMVREACPWRHLAVTWDATSKTLSYYLDYRLQQQTVLDAVPDWDLSQLSVGGGEGFDRTFEGHIDEVRVSDRALPAWEFLRLSPVDLNDVSFAPEATPSLPADYGHVDVRLHYGAVGDGKHDDTEAIRKAFAENQNRVPNEYHTVYFPAGDYRITDTIRFSRFLVVRGAGPERTWIRLADESAGFDNPEIPKPAFAVGYDGPYVDRPRKNQAGNVIGNYLFDLSIDTGSGNPAALGLDFHCNNVGCVENVTIQSGDGTGLVGLDFKRGWPGPCLMKNVTITGFDYGIDASYREYSLVFSDIRLRDQRVAAIRNRGNILSMEKVHSDNTVPAVENSGGGLVVLMRSRLQGGSPEEVAIRSTNASLYLRDVDVEGYSTSVVEAKRPKEGPEEETARVEDSRLSEFFTGPLDSAFPTEATGSLGLEIKDTPEIPRPPVETWVNVRDFADRVEEGDWAPAIQAAIDSGAELLYFPAGERYRIDRDVILRGRIHTFLGGSPKTGIGNGVDEKEDTSTGPALVIGPDLAAFQFDLLDTAHIRHAVPATLIIRHCRTGHVSAEAGCGELFIEDAGGKWRFNEHQRVWGRQLNPETKGIPEIINHGGQLWVLGLKTEYLSTKIENRNGARTEILGGLMYPVHPVQDETLPMFLNEDSDLSLVHGVSAYQKNHRIYCRDIRDGEARDFSEWRWVNGRPIANLYRSSQD